MERIQSFSLPGTFPEFMVPDEVMEFMKACVEAGLTIDELRTRANQNGYAPLWRPLPDVGNYVYGFGLDVNGLQVPFVVVTGLQQ